MTRKSKHVKRSKIPGAKFREIIKHFSLDLDAEKIAALTHVNRNTVKRYLRLIHERIGEFCHQESPFHGEIEADETYFGGKRIKGKTGRGAGSRTPVFSILQLGSNVYTEVVPNCAKPNLLFVRCGSTRLPKSPSFLSLKIRQS